MSQCAESDSHTLVIYNRYSSTGTQLFLLPMTSRSWKGLVIRDPRYGVEAAPHYCLYQLTKDIQDLSVSCFCRLSAKTSCNQLQEKCVTWHWTVSVNFISNILVLQKQDSLFKPGRRKSACRIPCLLHTDDAPGLISKPFTVLTYQPWYLQKVSFLLKFLCVEAICIFYLNLFINGFSYLFTSAIVPSAVKITL